jgi:Flp pilus assembly pilin Flp
MRTRARRLGQAGQGLAEYALILSIIAVAAIATLLWMSGTIQTILSTIGDNL